MNPTLRRWLTHPGFLFAIAWAALLALLFAPLLAGGVLVNPMSDGKDGYVTRHFAAEVIRTWGEVPRWNPYIFGGMPFLGAMHGDQVYPISVALRAVFAPALAIGLGMVFHCWLAATGLLAFMRRQGLSWSAAIVGATAYGVSGPLLSLFHPGHDGKIYVLGLTPWALLAIYEATRTRRPALFALWGLLVGLMLLSPHFQMTYYSSLLMGAFIFFCLFTETPKASRIWVLGGFGVASVLALMVAAAQLMPFAEYLPFSPRSAAGGSSTGWEYATSWAMPAIELVGTMWGGFNGWLETYWGTNQFKLHSDYVGLLVGVLALTAILRSPVGKERRRAWFWGIAVVFGTLWVLAGQTPFYRIPYHLFPMISKTRAASMMWGHVALCFGVLASLGLQQWELMKADTRELWAKRIAIAVVVGAGLMLASAQGLITSLAVAERADAAFAAVEGARIGLLLGAVSVLVFVIVAWRAPRMLAVAAVAMLLLDLGVQARRFIKIDPAGDAFFAADEVVQAIQRDATGLTQPWRVLPVIWADGRPPYMDDYLQEHRIRNVFGYHGNELHTYDELLGGKNQWRFIPQQQAWRLTATRYLLIAGPVGELPPGFALVGTGLRTWLGEDASVIRVPNPAPWAVISPGALKVADDAQVNATAINPQFDPARLTLVPGDAPFGTTTAPTALPPAISPAPRITVAEREPGVYVLAIDSLVQDGVLTVSENYVPWWKATVDGVETPVARANGTFVALQVPRGAKEVVLAIESPADKRGLLVSWLGLAGVVLFALSGLIRRGPRATEKAAAA
jgi:hypothetical protein